MAWSHQGPRSRYHFNIWTKLVKQLKKKNERMCFIPQSKTSPYRVFPYLCPPKHSEFEVGSPHKLM